MSVIGPSCNLPSETSPGCGCAAKAEPSGGKAAGTAVATAVAAAACTACCVLPFTLPAVVLASAGKPDRRARSRARPDDEVVDRNRALRMGLDRVAIADIRPENPIVVAGRDVRGNRPDRDGRAVAGDGARRLSRARGRQEAETAGGLMDALTIFGLLSVSAMLLFYALEPRGPHFS
ncbi:hypothetical protein ABIG05_001846 [Bradyrhizobium japonicum]